MYMEESMKSLQREFLSESNEICRDIPQKVRKASPLVHLLTNYVTVNDCVNALLAVGARAICSHAKEEARQVSLGCDALVCNLGGTEYYDAMELSAEAAINAKIPFIIDPVGCGASSHRRKTCLHFIRAYHPSAVRGNYAEIRALLCGHSQSAGLDSQETFNVLEEEQLQKEMCAFSKEFGIILIASGAVDLVTDGEIVQTLSRGTPALKKITGAGCMSSAVLGAFLACESSLRYACAAVQYINLAGEKAHRAALLSGTGAGHFHMFFMDFLSMSDPTFSPAAAKSDTFS